MPRYTTSSHYGEIFVPGQTVLEATEYGVTGVAGDDQTTALQAAIDACQALVVGNSYGAPILKLPPGQISLTAAVNLKSCGLSGAWPTSGTRIVWNGASGGTVFQAWATDHAGNSSFRLLENFNMRAGSAEPNTFIDFTTGVSNGLIDEMCRLRNIHLNGCLSDAIKMARWVNCHWEHLRFDLVGGFAIRLTPTVSQNLSTFRLDGFTYDHSRTVGPGGGVFLIDNSVADASNLGTFAISNGRIEINQPWAVAGAAGSAAASTRAVVTIRDSNTPTATRELGVDLSNITYADASGMANDTMLFRDSSNLTGSATLLWRNVRAVNLSGVLGGSWPAAIIAPLTSDLAGIGALNTFAAGAASLVIGSGARIYSGTGSPEGVVTAPIGSIFLRTDGGAVTSFYVKESGVGNTGWVAK